jgi:hypothetical protein
LLVLVYLQPSLKVHKIDLSSGVSEENDLNE